MKKSVFIGTNLFVFGGLVSSLAVAINQHNGDISPLFASVTPYSLTVNSGNAVTGEGIFNLRSSQGNDLKISYYGVSSSSGNFGTLKKGGYLLNAYDSGLTYKNAIGRLKSINVVFDGELTIDYSWGEEIYFDEYIVSGISLVSGFSYTFNDDEPNYFRLKAKEETTITSISLSYYCGTNSTYPNGYYTISNETELKAFRDDVNGGNKYTGKTVYVLNDISLTRSDFGDAIGISDSIHFAGTFNGLGHTISHLYKTDANQAYGLFSRVTNGTVKNLKLDDVTVTCSSQRAAGAIARAVDATIENVEILSGTITGSTQNGGVVGVIVAGSNKTVVKNCVNYATVSGTSAGGNGGVVGYVHSGTLEITNCLNYGNISATGTNTVGGILGSSSNSAATSISHCYASRDAVITNATAASSLSGGKAGYIHSGSNTTDAYINRFDTVISTASELRTFLAGSSDTVTIVKNNIDLNDVVNNDDTDYSRGTTFKGTFDGLGHIISHFKTKAATAALFKGVTNGIVTNLNMEHVYVNSTEQRGAALVSRLESSTVSEIVASGIVEGVTQNGGIIAAITGTDTIKDCTNYVDVTGTKTSHGGIVACCVTVATAFEISNCVNYGNITSAGIVAGGIIGGTNPNGTGKNYVHDCVNYGDIKTTQYIGGIIGIARENSHAESLIENCVNYGNVTGTSTISAGGVVGLARFEVSSCQCHRNIHVSLNNVSSLASDLSMVGGVVSGTAGGGNHRGYIAGTTGNDASASGSLTDGVGTFTESVANGNTSLSQAYGRIQMLGNGKSILTMANRFSISDKPGIDSYTKLVNRDTAINDGGFGYDYVPGHEGDADYKLWLANMEPLYLPDGRLFIFYRTDYKEVSTGVYYSSIRAIESRDNGQTWLSTRHIIFENYSNDYYSDGNIRGAYEPFAVLDDETLQIFIAFDAGATRAGGLGPDNTSFICKNYYQNLLRIPVDISDMGFTVGATQMAIKGVSSYRRPGMPSVVQLKDGNYAMILEHNGALSNDSLYAMRVAISYSHDLITWTAPQIVITPENEGTYYSGIKYLCGAPYIQLLNDGRIAVSYTTNDYYARTHTEGDIGYHKTVELAISDEVVSYGDTPTMIHRDTISYGSDTGARYGGCKVLDDKVILIANEYHILDNGTREVARGTVFSIATYR